MMNDDFGGAPDGGAVRRSTPQHLDTDALSAYIDGRLEPDAWKTASAHVASCPDCRRELDELRTTVALLRGLSQYRPRRSFTLGPAYAKTAHASRLARLLPFLPALRTATAVVALLLAVVAGADLLIDDERAPGPSSELTTVEAVRPAADAREPTGRDALSGNVDGGVGQEESSDSTAAAAGPGAASETELVDEAGSANAPPAAANDVAQRPDVGAAAPDIAIDSDQGMSSGARAEGGEAAADLTEGEEFVGAGDTEEQGALAALGADEADDQPGAGAANTAANPAARSDERSAVGSHDEGGLSIWQITQIGLGVALLALLFVLIAVQRLANHARRLDPGF